VLQAKIRPYASVTPNISLYKIVNVGLPIEAGLSNILEFGGVNVMPRYKLAFDLSAKLQAGLKFEFLTFKYSWYPATSTFFNKSWDIVPYTNLP